MLAPIVLFVYARPFHTKKTIEALSKNYLASESVLYIFSDAAKDEKSKIPVSEVRDYIHKISGMGLFKDVVIEEAPCNRGLARSVIYGVTKVMDEHDRVIVVEDDLVTAPGFLTYMNNALEYYKNNSMIWSISGYNLPIKIPFDYKYNVYFSYRGSSWGWATWKDRWEKVEWDVPDYRQFKRNPIKRMAFNRGGSDMALMLDHQMQGLIDSWAIRWYYSQFKQKKYTVYPVVSFVQNIGTDGSGTHSGKTDRYNTNIAKEDTVINLANVKPEKRILHECRKIYRGNWISFIVLLLRTYYFGWLLDLVKKIRRKV